MGAVDWKGVMEKAQLESGSDTFVEDWAEDLVDQAIDIEEDEEVGLVISTDGYMSISVWEQGEHSDSDTMTEVIRIKAFGDLSTSGEQQMLQLPVGSVVDPDTWSDFVQSYVAAKLGLAGQQVNESIKWVNEQGITWADFRAWDVIEYNLAIDNVVEKYLERVREVVADQINQFGLVAFDFSDED
ncbi:MAG: hypothetical protein ACI35P_01610 [Bacillus sp. (in: firmicutes)]